MNPSKMTLDEIKRYLQEKGTGIGEEDLNTLSKDPRNGVKKLYQSLRRQEVLVSKELARLKKMLDYEMGAQRKGFSLIAGVDEAGRGPLAGPVVAAAVILPKEFHVPGLDDSKKLSPLKRDILFDKIKDSKACWAVGLANVDEINSFNILNASLLAMERAVNSLVDRPDYILVDAVRIPDLNIPQLPIIKGDGKSLSIAAASIIAKVTRDRMMDSFDVEFPQYKFSRHKGYATREHINLLVKYGPCPLHRNVFIRNFTTKEVQETLW